MTNFERVSDTQFLIQIVDIESVNHVVVFMTGIKKINLNLLYTFSIFLIF